MEGRRSRYRVNARGLSCNINIFGIIRERGNEQERSYASSRTQGLVHVTRPTSSPTPVSGYFFPRKLFRMSEPIPSPTAAVFALFVWYEIRDVRIGSKIHGLHIQIGGGRMYLCPADPVSRPGEGGSKSKIIPM
jgi:hypothetical protein